MSLKVLIVGAGLTGSVIGSLVNKMYPELRQKICKLTIWDKARGAGGRMSTTRSPNEAKCTADVGAQYITALPEYYKLHHDFYTMLVNAQVLEPLMSYVEGMKVFPTGTEHFSAPNGINSIVKHFLKEQDVNFNHQICSIDKKNEGWMVKTVDGVEELFNAVILTMPVPQILNLTQDILNGELKSNLEKVQYSSRFALIYFYDSTQFPELKWEAKYISDNEFFRYVAIDNKKRNREKLPTAVVFHTTVQFGSKYLEYSLDQVRDILVPKVKDIFPDWPAPSHIKCHKWRYSQVLVPYEGTPGSTIISENPLLLAAGDGFAQSGFDGCIGSALSAVGLLKTFITNN